MKFTHQSNVVTLSEVSAASPPVTGTFSLTWNGQTLSGILN